MNLPSMQHSFSVSVKGDDTNQLYEGRCVYKRPNHRTKLEIMQNFERLVGPEKDKLPETMSLLMYMISFIKHTLIECPDWLKESNYGEEGYDTSVIEEIFINCQKFEEEYVKKVFPDGKSDGTK